MFVKYRFWKIKNDLSPSRAFKRSLWIKLEKLWTQKGLAKLAWYQAHWFRFSAAMALMIFVVSSLTTGAYAYVNPEVTPGTVLFPIKLAIESLEERAQITPEAKAKFVLKKISRRESEKATMEGNKKRGYIQRVKNIEKQIKKLEKNLEKMETKLNKKSEQGQKLRKIIEDRLEHKILKIETKLDQDQEELRTEVKRVEKRGSFYQK